MRNDRILDNVLKQSPPTTKQNPFNPQTDSLKNKNKPAQWSINFESRKKKNFQYNAKFVSQKRQQQSSTKKILI